MIVKIICLIIFALLSVWILSVNTKTAPTKTNILCGLGLWILGLYIGLIIATFYK